MNHRAFRRTRETSSGSEELNLTPFIDVFVTLIVFLLLSAVFVHLGSLAFKTPGSQSKSESDVPVSTKREVSLLVRVEDGQIKTAAYESQAGLDLKEYRKAFPITEIKAFTQFLTALKTKEGGLTRTLFQVAPATAYERAIHILEVVEKSEISQDVVLAVGTEGEAP